MLRGGIIGLGNIAINGHLPSYANDPVIKKNVEIVAAVDLKKDNCEKIKEHFPDINLYTDFNDLVKNEQLDFVDICTPPDTHLEIIEKAVQKNWHILCEKPIALNYKEAQKIYNLINSSQTVFIPCHQYHFSPAWQAIRKVVSEGKIGTIHFAQANIFRLRANEGNINWNPEWRTKKGKSGGGILMDHGAHLMYLFISLLGKPLKISANVKRLLHKHYEVEDTACMIFEFPECMVEFVLTWAGHSRRIIYKFLGDKGELYVGEDHLAIQYPDGKKEKMDLSAGMSKDSSHSDWFTPLISEFVKRIKNRDYRKDGVEEALLSFKYISMAYRSSELEKTLTVK